MYHAQSKPARSAADKEEAARRRLFCFFLARLGNPREAAVKAGYPPHSAARKAAELLEQKQLLQDTVRYARAEEELRCCQQALGGLRRLAFGDVNDAVALVMAADGGEPPDARELDLFAVSEIKRPKGGGCEIKFYDRLAALQALLGHDSDTARQGLSGSLCQALQAGAKAMAGGESGAV